MNCFMICIRFKVEWEELEIWYRGVHHGGVGVWDVQVHQKSASRFCLRQIYTPS